MILDSQVRKSKRPHSLAHCRGGRIICEVTKSSTSMVERGKSQQHPISTVIMSPVQRHSSLCLIRQQKPRLSWAHPSRVWKRLTADILCPLLSKQSICCCPMSRQNTVVPDRKNTVQQSLDQVRPTLDQVRPHSMGHLMNCGHLKPRMRGQGGYQSFLSHVSPQSLFLGRNESRNGSEYVFKCLICSSCPLPNS